MRKVPDLRELVGDVSSAELERLRRVHELLVRVGPPPELPSELAEPPPAAATIAFLPRNRLRTALVLAAALALAAFGAGYLLGDRGDGREQAESFEAARTVLLGGREESLAVVRIGKRDANGNRPMTVTVEGLPRQPRGNYYTLFMTRKGKPIVTCGTFNVGGARERTTVRFSVAYDPERFDGLLLSEYRTSDHKDHPLLRARL